ncbi:long-chain-fatty-acid--CoA ligase [Deinococcus ruber]|uniref:Long-chain-fatty-acid--CoA ligase n=1 Tax=Deinococcus ruber TaxID=1848197 RepID=A0A918CHR1_9DEIO|nr:long-chain-fatty-acid--CoA ligase [Deinococcus ruber]GGR24453.1 long-chain-fatty-acid--CoA ligase [Deinococcus ruber]
MTATPTSVSPITPLPASPDPLPPLAGRYWPKGKPRRIPLPVTSLYDNLQVSARRYPDKVATWFYGQQTSYADLLDQADRFSGYLASVGVQKGDRVMICLQNSPQWIAAAHAIWRLGAVVIPLAPMIGPKEFAFFLQDAGLKAGVVAAELYGAAREGGLKNLVTVTLAQGLPDDRGGVAFPAGLDRVAAVQDSDITWEEALKVALPAPQAQVSPADLCVMPYTSGTTGFPKGCMHTHSSVQANAAGGAYWANMTSADKMLVSLPFFHVTGFTSSMLSPMFMGCTLVIMARWDRETARQLIRALEITGWTNTATMVVDLLANPLLTSEDLVSLKLVNGGGASMPEALGKKWKELSGLEFLEGYGLSETMAQTHSNPIERPKLQCLGIPFFGVDARIIDLDTLKELPQGETGEIVLHGPQVFQGYWNRPEASQEAFLELDGKKFFRSGDLGYVDAEGYFFFVDRLKRMVNAAGMKVWPAEVEAMLHAHPAVQEAVVIAVPDERNGERARAILVLRDGMTVTEAEFIEWARSQMAHYKAPREVRFAESLPKGPTGKVTWRPLQEAARLEQKKE